MRYKLLPRRFWISRQRLFSTRREKEVLEFFTKANPYSEFNTNRELRQGLTGLWLTQGSEFEEWYTKPGSKIWCSGIPGAGKSVLAAAIIDECLQRNADNPRKALAYFFCTYRDEITQEPTSILSSLCSQLARQGENAFEILKEYHDELTSERQLQAATSKKLIQVLRRMCSSFDRVYLIVDGLDECAQQVEDCVESLAALLPSPQDETLNLALLSRDEISIREIVGDQFQNVEIEAHTEDIDRYVAHELDQRIASRKLRLKGLALKDKIRKRLVDGAKGMFRWAACQLDYLCELRTDGARERALDNLPPTLFATYERILARINESSQDQQIVQRTLLLISSPYHKHLSLPQICEAISLQEGWEELLNQDVVSQEEVLRCCGSLVRTRIMWGRSGNLSIEFSHFSVQEYLQDECLKHPTLSAYGVSREKACSLLASLCLDYLTLKSHEQLAKEIYDAKDEAINVMDGRDLQRPFYRHAATLWPFYVREAGEGCFTERIHSLFQLAKTPSFCLWATTLAAHLMLVEFPKGTDCLWHLKMSPSYTRSKNTLIDIGQDDGSLWFHTTPFRDTTISDAFHVLRPDFTPLHMAAILGMPDLCNHLLRKGANVNARGKFGTPLHCAIAGLGIFAFDGSGYGQIDKNRLRKANFMNGVGQLLGRRQPYQVLLKAEANPHLCFIDNGKKAYSSLTLAAISWCDERSLEIAIELIKAGITIGKEDLFHFQKRYATILDPWERGKCGESQAIVGFLSALSPADQEMNGTPRSRLYIETCNWAASMGIKDLDQLPTTQSTARFNDDEIIDIISLWIRSNNGLELGRFLESSRSELVKSTKFGHSNWSSLHLAIWHCSLDVLKILLEYGLDANIADEDGNTPAHLCTDVDQLRVLLEHGASMLVPNKTLSTVWHTAAVHGLRHILELLLELDVRQEALKMVCSRNTTPICSALNFGETGVVLLLLKHCDSREFWKSGTSIYREAAEMGSVEILQHLRDVDIELDGMDDITGSPLHYLSTYPSIEVIRILKDLFPLDQRRKMDLRTPLESILLRAVKDGTPLGRECLEVMLPNAAVSNSKEASRLWSFLGFEVTKSFMRDIYSDPITWLKDCVSAFITLGIMAKYEEERGESASLPFMSAVTSEATRMYKEALQESEQPEHHIYWDSISDMMQHVMGQSRHWDSAVGQPAATRLLSLAILHDDMGMLSFLLDKGVDIHSRLDDVELSPFEFACFPNVPISERGFGLLLKHTSPEKISQGNESLFGCGPLHFVAGWHADRHNYDNSWKLKQMLGAGVSPNLPLSAKSASPLVFHIHRGAISTAEMLLEAGADPWARGSYPFDAALEAVRLGRLSILTKIVAISDQSPCWDRTWVCVIGNKRFAGGNALHLAALHGTTECLEFYLSQGLLSNLEYCDDVLATPIHYAALSGQPSTIKFIKARGGSINARARDGLTPLHLAAGQGHLETAKTLINLGAEHQPCNKGCTPLVYAYAKGNESMIEALQSSSEESQESSSSVKSPGTSRLLAEAMRNAILRGDVAACERIRALGCPIDVELYDGVPVTPLAVAICHQQDPKIVQWLVDSGATVSTVFPQPYQNLYLTALEAAVAQPTFNSLLHKLLNKFLEEGGNFLDMARSPVHLAVDYNNIEGLRILLGWLRNTYGSSGLNLSKSSRIVERSSLQRDTLSAFVNQQDTRYHQTALHVAASKNNLEACAALIDSRADIEQADPSNRTPLHFAASSGSLQVAKDLLSRSARANPLNAFAETPLMLAYRAGQCGLVDLLTPYCKDMMRTNHVGENGLHFMTRFEPNPARAGSSLETLSRCIEEGASLYLQDHYGVAPVHWILASQSACHLRFLLNRDHRFLRPQEMTPWPGPWFLLDIQRLSAISKNLRLVQSFLSKHELCQLCVVGERGDHSLLCRAACLGSVEVIESLLALGVDMIEHQCNDHGTPLTAAISRGHTEAVKCLVSNGAKVPYDPCQPSDFEVSAHSPDFVIREWLFVGRHVEQRRISDVMTEAPGKIESWAGVRPARVALKWEWRRRREEGIWEYACRRQKILKGVRGKVVKCLEENTEGKDVSSDASDEEFSGRHYCLGRGRIRGARLIY
ncbi:hypothetical protein FALCPG4_005760 [Fusarium falciforme]